MILTLPSDLEFQLMRVFDAPRGLVFEAWTDPKHLRRWYGCDLAELVLCDADIKIHGGYRYTMRLPNGAYGTIFGVYREVAAPERLVYTQGFVTDGLLTPNALATVTFIERNGRTTLTSTLAHNSKADRDMHLSSGVEAGAGSSFDRLEAHLATMAPAAVS
jgi:uncharacterized protein YndB with AHSA1/START domain